MTSVRAMALAGAAWLLCENPVGAQSLEHMRMQYPQQLPEVLLEGTSPFYWSDIQATASVTERTIDIFVVVPSLGFSVMAPWSVSVPLPVLPVNGAYQIRVFLHDEDGGAINHIGFMWASIFDPRNRNPIFRSSFDLPLGLAQGKEHFPQAD